MPGAATNGFVGLKERIAVEFMEYCLYPSYTLDISSFATSSSPCLEIRCCVDQLKSQPLADLHEGPLCSLRNRSNVSAIGLEKQPHRSSVLRTTQASSLGHCAAHSGSTKASSVVDPGGACNSTKRSIAKPLARSSAIQSPCVRWNSVSPGASG